MQLSNQVFKKNAPPDGDVVDADDADLNNHAYVDEHESDDAEGSDDTECFRTLAL